MTVAEQLSHVLQPRFHPSFLKDFVNLQYEQCKGPRTILSMLQWPLKINGPQNWGLEVCGSDTFSLDHEANYALISDVFTAQQSGQHAYCLHCTRKNVQVKLGKNKKYMYEVTSV